MHHGLDWELLAQQFGESEAALQAHWRSRYTEGRAERVAPPPLPSHQPAAQPKAKDRPSSPPPRGVIAAAAQAEQAGKTKQLLALVRSQREMLRLQQILLRQRQAEQTDLEGVEDWEAASEEADWQAEAETLANDDAGEHGHEQPLPPPPPLQQRLANRSSSLLCAQEASVATQIPPEAGGSPNLLLPPREQQQQQQQQQQQRLPLAATLAATIDAIDTRLSQSQQALRSPPVPARSPLPARSPRALPPARTARHLPDGLRSSSPQPFIGSPTAGRAGAGRLDVDGDVC
jgi:hypothetical protein